MNKLELRQLLEEGEGYKIEFKEALSNLDKELVAFNNKRSVESTTPKTTLKTTPKTEGAILALLTADPRLRKADLARELSLTFTGIKYSIMKLTKSGVLRWTSSSKSGHWKVNKK
ncbi:MAG: winged helix-turn-helix transcriptional regulator [Elusimicrobiota bacterium]|nr:winged helix-turn-helix transcriptional regulator [Elusimicrobiota bacterium]